MVYLPVYPELPRRKIAEMAEIVRASARPLPREAADDVHVTRMA
jgi:hypothetical protein